MNVNVRLGGGGGGGYRWNNPAHRNYFASRWNGRARNFNYQAYRRAFVNPRRYRIGAYYRPSGWYYRRWGVGAYFPSLFWSSNYWLNDWGSYGLMSPPWGYEWVRYGNDAVLVDVRTGQILQVRYDIFW
ncbi:MAG: RcnB family protein [Caulobacteraceae bacterium]